MTEAQAQAPALVGDVGGTNCRLAIASRAGGAAWAIERVRTYRGADFPTFEDAVRRYLEEEAGPSVAAAVIAVAGPVEDGVVTMTNHDWRITERGLAELLGVARCRVINDFEALAHALPALAGDDLQPLGGPRAGPGRASLAVMGAGTGFGVAALIRDSNREAVLVGEGGHSAYAPQGAFEAEVWAQLSATFGGYVSLEHVLSGPGLVNLHRAMCEVGARRPVFETPDAITDGAAAGDEAARAVTDLFVQMLGGAAGNLALAFGARGGVFVAGGVSQRILSVGGAAAFRARFEAKGDFSPYLKAIPTHLIVRDQPGLLGAACALADLPGG